MEMDCQHCNYKWDYLGDNEYYATCPRCRYKVKIPEDKAGALRQKKLDQVLKGRYPAPQKPVRLLGIAGIVNKAMEDYTYDESMLIQILLRLQRNFGWLPREMLSEVSKQLGVSLSHVYQVVTFYKAFSLAPRGRHLIRVCTGTSCKVRGATTILDNLQRLLGVERGETTPDSRFSLETVNCLGCCALGPMMTVDGEYYGSVKLPNVKNILSKHG
ncbi:MAG TPA: NAD(P)H-dependent oxidoreductase subunit E [Candidatus Bathyarchaeia archaeon]|nr:NAD(P)H-dependent oxidoreductase subunit E [Candidatus Bathyarchaeia archaeon]